MTEMTLSAAALEALAELKERRPAERYEASVLRELRMNSLIADVSGGWIAINKRGLDQLYPTNAPRPAPSTAPKQSSTDKTQIVLDALKAAGGSMTREALNAHHKTLSKIESAGLITLADDGMVHLVSSPRRQPPVEPPAPAIVTGSQTPAASEEPAVTPDELPPAVPPMDATPPLKTRAQIDDLKRHWEADPCWDIEATEGFEVYADELHAFRLEKRAEWEALIVQQQAEWDAAVVRQAAHVEQSPTSPDPVDQPRTAAEVDALERQWLADPSWVLEKTPGFTAHAADLRVFAQRWHAYWQAEGFDVPADDTAEVCTASCVGCFNKRALDYLTTHSPAIRAIVEKYAALDQAEQRLAAFVE